MRVFVSWSGNRSKHVAQALREWLPGVVQAVRPWVSEADIDAGSRWATAISERLEETKVGILCVTRENQTAPWLLFEAGAMAKTLDATLVCPYLVGMSPTDLVQGPLAQFQAKIADKNGTWDVVHALYKALQDVALKEQTLRKTFERAWPDLQEELDRVPPETVAHVPPRSIDDMVRETLELVRSLTKGDNWTHESPGPLEVLRFLRWSPEGAGIGDLTKREIELLQSVKKRLSDEEAAQMVELAATGLSQQQRDRLAVIVRAASTLHKPRTY